MNKNDPRFVSAEKRITDAVYDLIAEKDLENVRTGDIIKRAGVHKSTFYSHYRDKYAVIDSLQDIAADVLVPHLTGITVYMLGVDADPHKLAESYSGLAANIVENKRLFLVVLNNYAGNNITTRIVSELERIWVQYQIGDPADMNVSYLINAAAHVITGTIEKWLQRGCIDSVENFTRFVSATGLGIQNAFEMLRS